MFHTETDNSTTDTSKIHDIAWNIMKKIYKIIKRNSQKI